MTPKPMLPEPLRPVTLAVACPVPSHGKQAAPAATVRIVRRTRDGRVVDWTVSVPCPTAGCPVVLLYAGATADATDLSLSYLARLNAAGARLLNAPTEQHLPASAITDVVTDVTHFAFPDPGGAA